VAASPAHSEAQKLNENSPLLLQLVPDTWPPFLPSVEAVAGLEVHSLNGLVSTAARKGVVLRGQEAVLGCGAADLRVVRHDHLDEALAARAVREAHHLGRGRGNQGLKKQQQLRQERADSARPRQGGGATKRRFPDGHRNAPGQPMPNSKYAARSKWFAVGTRARPKSA